MGEIGSAFHQNNITIKVSMSFRASDNIAEKLQELKVLLNSGLLYANGHLLSNVNLSPKL